MSEGDRRPVIPETTIKLRPVRWPRILNGDERGRLWVRGGYSSAGMPLDPEFTRAIRERIASSEFAKWMGNEITSFGEGECEMRLLLQPHHLNPGGIVHGGVIAALIDSAIGLALRTRLGPGSRHVTLTLDVQYVRMVRGGTLTAKGRAVHSGSRAGFGEATMDDEAGRLVAKGTATFIIVSGTADTPDDPDQNS